MPKPRIPVHPSIAALLREGQPGGKAADIMRRKCREMVRHAKSHCWNGPPYEPRILAGLNKIRIEATEENIDGEGCIFALKGKIIIKYRPGLMLERERFTLFHELAHTCFPDVYDAVRRYADASINDAAHREFEGLCDIGAGELLLPQEDFLADLQASHVCLAYLGRLGIRYRASLDATVRRALDLTSHPCAAAFLTDEGFKDFSAVAGRLRLKYLWKSSGFKYFVPSGILVPRTSVAHAAPQSANDDFPLTRETWWINNRPYSWYIQSVRLPAVPQNKEYPKILALLHAVKPAVLKKRRT